MRPKPATSKHYYLQNHAIIVRYLTIIVRWKTMLYIQFAFRLLQTPTLYQQHLLLVNAVKCMRYMSLGTRSRSFAGM